MSRGKLIGTERLIARYGNSVRRCEYDYAAAIVCEDFEWVWMPAVVQDGGYAFPHSDGLVCDTCQTDSIQQWGYALLGLRVSLDEISLNDQTCCCGESKNMSVDHGPRKWAQDLYIHKLFGNDPALIIKGAIWLAGLLGPRVPTWVPFLECNFQ